MSKKTVLIIYPFVFRSFDFYRFEIEELEKKETTFSTILDEIINKSKDNYLFETYQLVINNKQIKASDVIYLE